MRINVLIFLVILTLLITGVMLGYILSQLIKGFLTVGMASLLATLILILIIVILFYILVRLDSRQRSRSLARGTLPQQNQSIPNSQLQSRLIAMLAGDRATAERLIHQQKLNNPGRLEDWYWESVLNDLERELGTTYQQDQITPLGQLQNQLIARLNGDRAAAVRLVQHFKLKYPGNSEDWYWKKAIGDRER